MMMQTDEATLTMQSRAFPKWQPGTANGLDGESVSRLLQGARLKNHNPLHLLERAGIDPAVYGSPRASIDGQALVRLVRKAQFALDDVYLGFLPHGCRLKLETERIMCLMHAGTLGEALRVSVRFTDAMAPDVAPLLQDSGGAGLQHTCRYSTIEGVDRSMLVWIRFTWIYQYFSWLIGRPLRLRGLTIQGSRPVQQNAFDRFALFQCPVAFDAPVDSIIYDNDDLARRLVHSSSNDYDSYYSNDPDWFGTRSLAPSWTAQTEMALIDLQRDGIAAPEIQAVAQYLKTNPRRLRQSLSAEGESFRGIRTRLRGEIAGAYLVASDVPIQEIGHVLGFSEPGSFSRHFIAWSGMSPSAYRLRNLANSATIAAATALLNERRRHVVA